MMTSYEIIKKPIITENSMDQMADRKYTFEVAKEANKVEIKKAVEEIFGVTVEKVTTMRVLGKIKRMGRSEGRTPTTKKAYVILKKDSKPIAFFEGMAD